MTIAGKAAGTPPKTRIDYLIIKQFDTASKFLVYYLRPTDPTAAIATFLASNYGKSLNSDSSIGMSVRAPGEIEEFDAAHLVFSKRIYIYHDGYLSSSDSSKVIAAFRTHGITVTLRSADYLTMRKLQAQATKAKD